MSKLAIVFDESVNRVSFGQELFVGVPHILGAPLDVGDYLLLVTHPNLPIPAYQTHILGAQHTVNTDSPLDSAWKYRTKLTPIPSDLLYPHLSHPKNRVRQAIEQILNERDPLALLVYRSEPHESHL